MDFLSIRELKLPKEAKRACVLKIRTWLSDARSERENRDRSTYQQKNENSKHTEKKPGRHSDSLAAELAAQLVPASKNADVLATHECTAGCARGS